MTAPISRSGRRNSFRTTSDLLKKTHRLRDYLASARARVHARPEDLGAASRVFYYYQQEGNLAEARQTLVAYRLRMESRKAQWTSTELWQLGRLFEAVHDYNEAARCYYALYSLPGVGADSAEKSLAAIINVLLSAPEQPVRFGTEDFSMVRDIGTLDPYPGFLNGIVSLLLNSQRPAASYAQAESASAPYFHRVEAAELLSLFDSRFPKSPQRAELHAKLIEVYAGYSQSGAVIQSARTWLNDFPNSRPDVCISLCFLPTLCPQRIAWTRSWPFTISCSMSLPPALTMSLLAPEPSRITTQRTGRRKRLRSSPGVRCRFEPRPGCSRSRAYVRLNTLACLTATSRGWCSLNGRCRSSRSFRREIDHNPNDPWPLRAVCHIS